MTLFRSLFEWPSELFVVTSRIVGTRRADTLNAQADRQIVFGLQGDDLLSSDLNRTVLVGGKGDDTLTTDFNAPTDVPSNFEAIAVQLGDHGRDTLRATINASDPGSSATIVLDGGGGGDQIDGSALANTATTLILGGRGDDTINAVADARGSLGDNLVTNIVAAGSGDDHVDAVMGLPLTL